MPYTPSDAIASLLFGLIGAFGVSIGVNHISNQVSYIVLTAGLILIIVSVKHVLVDYRNCDRST
jgi:hypothetical protein